MAKPLTLEKILFSQGFGTRRYCSDLVYADLVKVNGVLADWRLMEKIGNTMKKLI
jgi:16S rRNA pseudouridine516 synthase